MSQGVRGDANCGQVGERTAALAGPIPDRCPGTRRTWQRTDGRERRCGRVSYEAAAGSYELEGRHVLPAEHR